MRIKEVAPETAQLSRKYVILHLCKSTLQALNLEKRKRKKMQPCRYSNPRPRDLEDAPNICATPSAQTL